MKSITLVTDKLIKKPYYTKGVTGNSFLVIIPEQLKSYDDMIGLACDLIKLSRELK